MNEKIKSKRAVRRRRTTRRLTRKPIRVPEDKVPRTPFGSSNPPAPSVDDAFAVEEGPPGSVDLLIHEEFEPTPKVSQERPRVAIDDWDEADDALVTISRPPPDPRALRDNRPREEPPLFGDDEVDTSPQIELTEEMALAAGRLTSPEIERYDPLEEEVKSDPRIREEAEGDSPAVIVSPARVISDRPGPFEPPLASRLSAEELEARAAAREVEVAARQAADHGAPGAISKGIHGQSVVLDDDEAEGSVTVDDSMVLEEQEAHPQVRTPPPPPDSATASPGPPPRTNGKSAGVPHRPPPPPPRARSQEQTPWWADFFDEDYLQTYSPPTRAQVARQCDFICETLDLKPGMSVLDLGSGVGLQAVELARRGLQVVGIDASKAMCSAANEEATQASVSAVFEQEDMREIQYEGRFDVVLLLGTSFGFFDEDAHLDLLRRACRALKSGGGLMVDVVNRDYVLSAQPNLVWFQGDDCICMEETDFNYFTSRLTVKRTVMRDGGRQLESDGSIRLFSLHELGQLIQASGFRVREVSAQEYTRGLFFGSNSMRMIFVAEKVG